MTAQVRRQVYRGRDLAQSLLLFPFADERLHVSIPGRRIVRVEPDGGFELVAEPVSGGIENEVRQLQMRRRTRWMREDRCLGLAC